MIEPDVINTEEMELLVKEIFNLYGYDFSQYSKASLKRRLNRICMIDRFSNYQEFRYRVLNDTSYLPHLIDEITVNVTEMFRDPDFYSTLRSVILPNLSTHPFIRIWVAGCATGEEAYSMAILLEEAGLYHKSLIYATDINPSVLEEASAGVFPIKKMKTYSENYIRSKGTEDFSRYYTAGYDAVKFDRRLRTRIMFSTHNLVSDSSFNEFQLIMCRNVLIYFEKELQGRVFKLFDESLQNLGYLALGSKETIRFSNLEPGYRQIGNEKIWKKTNLTERK
jgi:chemotaxis protein methyltransferase CheR